MSFAAASSTPERAPEALIAGMLSVLRALAAAFVAAFGDPAALIKGGALYGKTRERVLRWLHDMEAVVRRLLLLRAAMFPAPPPRALHVRAQTKQRRPREGAAEVLFGPAEDPAQWRVSFRMPTPPEPLWMLGGFRAHEDQYDLGHSTFAANAAAADKRADEKAASFKSIHYYWVDDPRPLAERFEALRRVIDDPDHYAARLAQRLYGWRGREERRQLFLTSLCATAPIANEAGLPDEDWQAFAEARPLTQSLLPVFSQPLRAPEPPMPDIPAPSRTPERARDTALKTKPEIVPEIEDDSDDDMSFDELVAEIEARMQAIRDST